MPALRAAGFPSEIWEEATEHLDLVIDSFCSQPPQPRDSEVSAELNVVLTHAAALSSVLDKLSNRTRLAILDVGFFGIPRGLASRLLPLRPHSSRTWSSASAAPE